MRKFFTLLIVVGSCCSTVFPQAFDFGTRKDINISTTDWSYTIDTTWGAGLSTIQKLQVFDAYWNKFDQTWGGFPNLDVDWNSLKTVYRQQVEAGVSRGRFYGILCRMSRALNEWHSWIKDPGVDSIFGIYYSQYGGEIEYPNFQSFHYEPGIPLLNLSPVFRSNFGAGVTAFQDSIALVYSVMPNHPLSLQPGDIILGYDGLLWKQNLLDLLNQELPLLFGGGYSAASPESRNHANIINIGMNWGLFDTIDILKYSTGDTLHYPTALLENITQPYFICTEQLPVSNVPFPDLSQNKMVSWGVVDGTTIGYIYVWDWYETQTRTLFAQAVDELMHQQNVTGLILDFRINGGGEVEYANDGFRHLFNVDPTSNFSGAVRVPGSDHFLFNIESPWSFFFFTPTSEIFDHPIAVLTGPFCGSGGDYNAFRMRFHPMARFFGKKSATAYTYINGENRFSSNYYKFRVDNGSLYSNFNNEGYIIHKGFTVDEEAWLTRDGVASGQDEVVDHAIEWINNVVYPHDILSDKTYYTPGIGSVNLSTVIENPNSHQLSARGYIHNLNDILIDSVDLAKQNLEATGENWAGSITTPAIEDFFKISVTAFDQTASTSFTFPNAIRFTTVGSVVLDSLSISKVSDYYTVKPFVKNLSTGTTITSASVKLICNDPWITSITPTSSPLPNIPPGAVVSPSSGFTVRVDTTFTDYFNFKVEISSANWPYWVDSTLVVVGVEDEPTLPTEYALEQNYPNPFNPVTIISYSLPKTSLVQLKIFNVLGQEIATLINEEIPAGTYELTWYAAHLPSGVYFYRLKAGDFISVKKMLLLK